MPRFCYCTPGGHPFTPGGNVECLWWWVETLLSPPPIHGVHLLELVAVIDSQVTPLVSPSCSSYCFFLPYRFFFIYFSLNYHTVLAHLSFCWYRLFHGMCTGIVSSIQPLHQKNQIGWEWVDVESTILEIEVSQFGNSTIHEQQIKMSGWGWALLVLAQVSTMGFGIPFWEEK